MLMETDFAGCNSLWSQVPGAGDTASELEANRASAGGCKRVPAWHTDPILSHPVPALPVLVKEEEASSLVNSSQSVNF